MKDRKLLELAAKAAGIGLIAWTKFFDEWKFACNPCGEPWNPLIDDADAFRLAVKLNLLIDCASHCARPIPDGIPWQDGNDLDPYAATRRAIVRAAAEVAKQEVKP